MQKELTGPLTGRKLKNYRVLDQIGHGGMGAVYVGFDEMLGRQVALKVLHGNRNLDPGARFRFQREARLLSRIEHPNVCSLFEFFEENGIQVLVMELAEGRPLSQADRKRPLQERLALVEQIASVLDHGHRQGILHRDLKPDNVLVDGDQVKVLDFGLARFLEDEAPTLETDGTSVDSAPAEAEYANSNSPEVTHRGRILGTPSFMSPEQARGDRVGTSADLFALGQLAHFLFAENPPYGRELTPAQVLERAASGTVDPPVGVRSDIRRLILALKAEAAEERPTAAEALKALRRARLRNPRIAGAFAAAIAILVLVGLTAKYVTDLRSARSLAEQARAESESARQQAEASAQFFSSIFRRVRPLAEDPRSLSAYELLERARARLETLEDLAPLDRAHLAHELGRTYHEMGDRNSAAELYGQAEALRRTHLGEGHPLQIDSFLSQSAMIRADEGRKAEAYRGFESSLKQLEPHKRDVPNIWFRAVRANLVRLTDMHQLQEAEDLISSAEPLVREHFGRASWEWLHLMVSRAQLHTARIQKEQALSLLKEIDPLVDELIGPDNPLWHEHMDAMAIAHFQLGRSAEAEQILRRQLEVLPDTDPPPEEVVHALDRLATVLSFQGKQEEAFDAASRSYRSALALFGDRSAESAHAASTLAAMLNQIGRFAEAEDLVRQWAPLLAEYHGESSFFYLQAMAVLAQSLEGQGRSDEAASLPRVH